MLGTDLRISVSHSFSDTVAKGKWKIHKILWKMTNINDLLIANKTNVHIIPLVFISVIFKTKKN